MGDEASSQKNDVTSISRPLTRALTRETVSINNETIIGNIKYGEFKKWIQDELIGSLKQVIISEVETATKTLIDQLQQSKKEIKELKNNLAKSETKVVEIETKLAQIESETKASHENILAENSTLKKACDNLVTYVVNLDRNIRRKNILIFGISETNNLKINNTVAKSDYGKVAAIFKFLNIEDYVITDYFRIGKKDSETNRDRPIKVCLDCCSIVTEILSKSKKLKNLVKDNQAIYIKPDKTIKERQEFNRLLKRKADLMSQYPDDELNKNRVTLLKGSLKVDGVEVDNYKSPQTIF